MRGVEDNVNAVQPLRHAAQQMQEVSLARIVTGVNPADRSPVGRSQVESAAAVSMASSVTSEVYDRTGESLKIFIIRHRIMAGRQHDAEIGVEIGHQKRRLRRG